jgi:penicillin-binding protein 1C
MWNVTGITGAAPLWSELIREVEKNKVVTKPKAPAGIVTKVFKGKQEWFLSGTEPNQKAQPREKHFAKIKYPLEGTVIAWDPDIPKERQKVFFEAEISSRQAYWQLDGKLSGSANEPTPWSLTPGVHELALVSANLNRLDTVRFEVKGEEDEVDNSGDF